MATVLISRTLGQADRRLRWFIVGWLTLSTILNLIDRQTLSILAPTLKDQFGLTNKGYSNIINAFLLSYTIMYTVSGRIVDRVGERIGMAVCMLWWSIATMLHSLARGGLSLGIFRFLLGIGEPGNYPSALRATTTWFSKSERGLPIAIYSSGSSVGSLIAAPLVAFITIRWGWRTAFFVPGLLGLVWLWGWLWTYRAPGREQPSPSPIVPKDTTDSLPHRPLPTGEPLSRLLKDKNVQAILLARFLSDPVWVFFLFWTADYLKRDWGFSLTDIGLYAWIPFIFGGLGGVLGGVASDFLIRRGLGAAAARRKLLYLGGMLAPVGMLTGFVGSPAASIALIALMAFVCYVWFINTAALVSDVFPERVVGSVQGLMGTTGCIGGMLFTWLAGFLLDTFSSYKPVFIIAGSGHALASLTLWALMRENLRAKEGEVV
jgi:ACS family hexuronate transporter-like MFS transporter